MKINLLISQLHKLVHRKTSHSCPEPVFKDALFSLSLWALKCVEMHRSTIATCTLSSLVIDSQKLLVPETDNTHTYGVLNNGLHLCILFFLFSLWLGQIWHNPVKL